MTILVWLRWLPTNTHMEGLEMLAWMGLPSRENFTATPVLFLNTTNPPHGPKLGCTSLLTIKLWSCVALVEL